MNTLAYMTEKEWTAQVVELARMLGFARYHTFRSDRSPAGWPDEALVRERLVLLELKSEAGKLSEAQKDWIGKLAKAGVEIYIVRPRHLDQLATILSARRYSGVWTGPRADEAREAEAILSMELPVPAD